MRHKHNVSFKNGVVSNSLILQNMPQQHESRIGLRILAQLET